MTRKPKTTTKKNKQKTMPGQHTSELSKGILVESAQKPQQQQLRLLVTWYFCH